MMAPKKLLAAALASLPLVAFGQTTPAEPAKPAEAAPAATPAPAAAPAPAPKPAEDVIKVTPYGFVLLNTFWNADTFATKDYPGQVAAANQGGAFLMSARQSRLGVRLSGKDTLVTGADLSGVIEFDFKAGHLPTAFQVDPDASPACPPDTTTGACNPSQPSTAWYNGLMRLRLAAASATWKFGTNSFSAMAGQEYGLVNPLFAESLAWVADPLFWQAGNLWRRSPQIRLTYGGAFGPANLTLAGAMLSPQDANAPVDFGAGNKSRVPDLEGRAALGFKASPTMSGTLGVAYSMGTRRYLTSTTSSAVADDVDVSSFGVDAEINVPFLTVKGEYYMNEGNDDAYFGIITNSIGGAAGSRAAVNSDGYWVQGIVKPFPALWVTVGYGVGNADEDDLTANAAAGTTRIENTMLQAGVLVNAGKWWRFGLEGMQVETKTLNGFKDDGIQIALSSQLKF